MQTLLGLLLVVVSSTPRWEIAARTDGITVLARDNVSTGLCEYQTIGLLDAQPAAVWAVLWEFANYTKTMPYTEKSEILATEDGGRILHVYSANRP